MENRKTEIDVMDPKKDKWTDGIWIPIVVLGSVFLFMALYGYVFTANRRVEGYATVKGDGFIISDTVECVYPNVRDIETKCEQTSEGVHFVSTVTGAYCKYTFTLCSQEITVKPEVYFYRVAYDSPDQWKIDFDLHKENGIWNATVSGVRNNHEVSIVECTDVEKNGIILDFWGESSTLQLNEVVNLRQEEASNVTK